MTQAIWKFELDITDEQNISVPAFHEWLHVGLDPNGKPCIWGLVWPYNKKKNVKIHVIGTGNPVPETIEACDFVGSFVDGIFVWHVFQV